MGNFKSFVLGKDKYPDWFQQLDKENKVTYELDSRGALLRIRVQNPVGAVRINVGETVVNTDGIIVKLTKAITDKYLK